VEITLGIAAAMSTARHVANGRILPDGTVARVMLRPIGSSLPLGAFALVPSGLLLAGSQLGWFSTTDEKMIPLLLLGLAVPLMLVASVLAFMGRDALVGTGFGIFAGTWLAYSLAAMSGPPGRVSHALGVFFLGIAALFAMLTGGGLAGGKAAAGIVILMGSARFLVSGIYELTGTAGLEHAAGIVGLVFVAVAAYVGFATLLEDSARRTILPIGRRGVARAAFAEGLGAQLDELEHEAGVREQL
jgi:succinate-acetate transporter protein